MVSLEPNFDAYGPKLRPPSPSTHPPNLSVEHAAFVRREVSSDQWCPQRQADTPSRMTLSDA